MNGHDFKYCIAAWTKCSPLRRQQSKRFFMNGACRILVKSNCVSCVSNIYKYIYILKRRYMAAWHRILDNCKVLLWILVITATNRNGQNRNGHKPKQPQTETATNRDGHRPERPQTETATDRNGHKPERSQTETATNRNSHKPKRPQTGTATNRNRHNYIWFSGLQMCVLNRSFKPVSRSRQK